MAIGTVLVVVVGWVTVASAVDEGWYAAVDQRDKAAHKVDAKAKEKYNRAQELDEYLAGTLADAETAERATDELRRDVTADVVRWDVARRRAGQKKWTGHVDEGRILETVIAVSGLPATESWRAKVRLLAEISDELADADALLVRRGRLDVQRAVHRATKAQILVERDELVAAVSDGGEASDQLAAERDRWAEVLTRRIEEADSRPSDEDFHRKKRALLPPVSAVPDYGFGSRRRNDSEVAVRHTGVTYFVDVGAEVRSVASGRVVVAERIPGFGNTVVVEHGKKYHSVYAHLDEFDVELYDEVEGRASVGTSGDSGSLEGPKLYFELRRNAVPVDPQQWFVR